MKRRPILLVVTGPSGSGKTTVCSSFLRTVSGIKKALTCTTRPPRPGEMHGKDYLFISKEEFFRHIKEGNFIEHAQVYGEFYGILKDQLITELLGGTDLLLNVDVQGIENLLHVASAFPLIREAMVSIFMSPPSIEELQRRLIQRGTESTEELSYRVQKAQEELKKARLCDYILLSTTPEEDLHNLQSIYFAERQKASRIIFLPWETPPKLIQNYSNE